MLKFRVFLFVCLSSVFLLPSPKAHAQEDDVQSEIGDLEKRLDEQDDLISKQQDAISLQAKQIREQEKMIDALMKASAKNNAPAAAVKNKTSQASQAQGAPSQVTQAPAPLLHPAPSQKVEQSETMTPPTAPHTEPQAPPQIEALADQGGVLSAKGNLTFENTIEYTNTTRNLFTFNGVELAQVVLVGAINDTTARHQIVQETGRLRLGITDRLEGDVHVPFVYRNDALTTTNPTTGVSIPSSVEGADLGDIDAGLAYQMNNGTHGWPFLIGNVRYKANNADGPYDVPYNDNNIATRLPTGTGFQTAEASVTAIKVSDPAVLFANIGYVYDISRDIDRNFAGTYVTHVKPGDAVNALVGMAFAINQDTSFSLGYKHSYVFPTIQDSVDLATGTASSISSGSAQVGALTFALSYALTPRTSVNFNIESGVTNDAPDVHLMVRVPFLLGKVF